MMSDSTRRAVRTLYQGLFGLVVAVPAALLILIPYLEQVDANWSAQIVGAMTTVVAVTSGVSKVLNWLEERYPVLALIRKQPKKRGRHAK